MRGEQNARFAFANREADRHGTSLAGAQTDSGFENVRIRISQSESPRVFGFMIKKREFAIKLMVPIQESFGIIQKLLVLGFEKPAADTVQRNSDENH